MLRTALSVFACVALLAACGEEEKDPTPLPCRTPAGTFTLSWSLVSNTCENSLPAIPTKDETFSSGECGAAHSRDSGTYDNGCTYEEKVEINGDADGYSGTDVLTIDCTGVGGTSCALTYNIHFEER